MQRLVVGSTTNSISDGRYVSRLSRREFVRLALLASGGAGLWLAGCSSGTKNGDPLTIVDEWIRALNEEDQGGFEKLHADSVFFTRSNSRQPFSGRDEVWRNFLGTKGGQIEKIVAFSDAQSVCLMVNATKRARSLCFVFNFEDGLINKVYEYSSGQYDLSRSPQFSGIEITGDDTGLQDRLDILDYSTFR